MEVTNDEKIKFSLRDYQEDASKNIKQIYNSIDHNRFAGVVLPTGGGKSFVAIEQLLSFKNDNFREKSRTVGNDKNNDRAGINSASMLYVAPNHEILSQIKIHIVKNVLLAIPKESLEKMSISEINNYMKEKFSTIKFNGINKGVDEKDKITNETSANDKINAILKQLSPVQITTIVRNAFPNLNFKCYAGVKSDNQPREIDSQEILDEDIQKAEFIIVDEAHRLGASTWGANFEKNLARNKNAKVLAITATPDRTDETGKNMLAGIAKMIYPNESVPPSKYVAKEIYVLDAIKDGIVNSPKVIQCNSALADSKQYKDVLAKYESSKGTEKKELGKILDKMENIIGFSPRKMSSKEVKNAQENNIKSVIEENARDGRINKNGKYIVFIPNNSDRDGNDKKSSSEYFKEQIERIKKQFSGVLDKDGNPVKLNISFVTSNTDVKVDKDGNIVDSKDKNGKSINNSQTLKDFEDASNDTGGIKILVANDMLNEGVHVSGIDGAIMLRNIDKSTLYLQQSGRCISSLNPNKPFDKQSKTIIIDAVGNSLKQVNNKTGKQQSFTHDLVKIKQLRDEIKKNNGAIPDINKVPESNYDEDKVKAEMEARRAIILKRLKVQYYKYKDSKSLPIKDEATITEILKVAEEINLWDMDIKQRTIEPSEKELIGDGFLEYTPEQNEFMKLYDEAIQKSGIIFTQNRINKLINITRILKMHNPNIELPQGISIDLDKKNLGVLESSNTKSINFEEFLRENFDAKDIESILVELQDFELSGAHNRSELYHPGEKYDLGKEIAFVRGKIWTSEYDFYKMNKSYFENYNMDELIGCGLIVDGQKDLQRLNEMLGEYTIKTSKSKTSYPEVVTQFMDDKGRVKPNMIDSDFSKIHVGLIDKFEEVSLHNKEQDKMGEKFFDGYDREGYDINGYDREGYNRMGFNKDNINKDTLTKFDSRGFYYDKNTDKWLNEHSNDEYDLLGYNIFGYDREGFERPKMENGMYIKPKWHRRKEDGTYDLHGYYMKPEDEKILDDKPHDVHGFKGSNRDNGPIRKYDKNNETNEQGFYSNGATRKETKRNPLMIKDFYVITEEAKDNKLKIKYEDIDGYNAFGYKKVKIGNKEKYIHRDTSYEYDKEGRKFDPKSNIPKQSTDIKMAKEIIQKMLYEGKNKSELCTEYIEIYKRSNIEISKEQIENGIRGYLDQAFKLYETCSPNAFDAEKSEIHPITGQTIKDVKESQAFKGLDTYLYQDSNSSEKRKLINEFYELCPRARKILERSTNHLKEKVCERTETKEKENVTKSKNKQMHKASNMER